MRYIITEDQLSVIEDDMSVDPCYEKTIKFYQSPEGRELLELLRKQMDGMAENPRFRLDKESRKRVRYLMRIAPKC